MFACLFRSPAALARDNVGSVPPRPVVLWSGRIVPSMTLFRLSQKVCQSRDVHVAEPSSGESRVDLLEQPAIAVRIAERGERDVTAPLRIRAAERRLSRPGTVEHFAYVYAMPDEFGTRCLDVGHDEIQYRVPIPARLTSVPCRGGSSMTSLEA